MYNIVSLSLEVSVRLFFSSFLFSFLFIVMLLLLLLSAVIFFIFSFQCCPQVCFFLLIHQHNPQCWLVFFLLFLKYMLSLWCKVCYIVINFLVLWSVCLSFSLVHFKNGPGHLFLLFSCGTPSVLLETDRGIQVKLLYYYGFTPLGVFYTSVSLWLLTGVWMTASPLKSPVLFSVY